MRLEKWYADVVDNAHVSVHYRANLSLGPLDISYRGQLDGQAHRRGTFSPGTCKTLPRLVGPPGTQRLVLTTDSGSLAWRDAISRPVRLWSDGRHHVDWDPLVLNGAVEGTAPRRGYAEKLVMTIAPWRLAIDRLWWGRFCGDRRSVVWIAWEGRTPLRLSLVDGQPSRLNDIRVDAVETSAVRLRLGKRRLLVDQTLGAGSLADMPWPRRIAPISFLSGRERKWFGWGELQGEGGEVDHGEVILEMVEWP
jgi:hypothetical protein